MFAKVRDAYQIHVWSHPQCARGLLVATSTGNFEHISLALAKLLRLMNGRRALSDVAKAFAREYCASAASVLSIVKDAVSQFVAEGMVEISPGPLPAREFSAQFRGQFHLALLQIQLTNRCNLHCLHCYANSSSDAQTRLLTEHVLQLIDEFSRLGGVRLFLTGGEPLLHPGLDVIIQHAQRQHIFVYLSTNGYAVDAKKADELVNLGVGAVNVSIDGACADTHDGFRETPGAFVKARSAIELFISRGIPCATQTTVFKGNLDQCEEIVSALRPRGVSKCYFVRMMPQGRACKHRILIPTMEQYRVARERELRSSRIVFGDTTYPKPLVNKRRRCTAAVSQLYVQADGRCYPCPSLAADCFLMGTYPSSRLEQIWQGRRKEVIELRAFDASKMRECPACRHARACRGGCFGNALLLAGDWREPDPQHCALMDSRKRIQSLNSELLE